MSEQSHTTDTWAYATSKISNHERIKELLKKGYEPFATSREWSVGTLVHFRKLEAARK